MKKLILLAVLHLMGAAAIAQTDSTSKKADTIRIGNIIIIKKNEQNKNAADSNEYPVLRRKRFKKSANNTTNWGIVDLGFANYNDKTNYAAATAGNVLVNAPGTNLPLAASDFKLNVAKSINVNIWFFMQRLNLVKHFVNLKYGLGLELNNYRFRSAISFKEPGISPYGTAIQHAYIISDSIGFAKNKLAADYITVPLMLNFCTNPANPHKGISVSAGVSAGYLYSQRNKQVSANRGKQKNKGDYNMEQFKFSYIAELGLGPVKLYGSYTPKSIFANALDLRAYTLGIRLSSW